MITLTSKSQVQLLEMLLRGATINECIEMWGKNKVRGKLCSMRTQNNVSSVELMIDAARLEGYSLVPAKIGRHPSPAVLPATESEQRSTRIRASEKAKRIAMAGAIAALMACSLNANADFRPFPGGPAVNLADFGGVPNDAIEDTAAFAAALGAGNRTVNVTVPGTYLIGKTEIPSNTTINLSSGVVLKDTGRLSDVERLLNIRGVNVVINGPIPNSKNPNLPRARVISSRSDYTSGEQRHGVLIFGAQNVQITGIESSMHGGDGFAIGGPAGSPSIDISIQGVLAVNNRRQGMSIISAINLQASGTFTDTSGTRPSLGIDIEPNNPQDALQNIRIFSPRTSRNAGGGISIGLSGFGSSGPAASINISDHVSTSESPIFVTSSIRPFDSILYTRSK